MWYFWIKETQHPTCLGRKHLLLMSHSSLVCPKIIEKHVWNVLELDRRLKITQGIQKQNKNLKKLQKAKKTVDQHHERQSSWENIVWIETFTESHTKWARITILLTKYVYVLKSPWTDCWGLSQRTDITRYDRLTNNRFIPPATTINHKKISRKILKRKISLRECQQCFPYIFVLIMLDFWYSKKSQSSDVFNKILVKNSDV